MIEENERLSSSGIDNQNQNLAVLNALDQLTLIAQKHISALERRNNLESRNNDTDDFFPVSIWSLKSALIDAYNLGLQQGIIQTDMRSNPSFDLDIPAVSMGNSIFITWSLLADAVNHWAKSYFGTHVMGEVEQDRTDCYILFIGLTSNDFEAFSTLFSKYDSEGLYDSKYEFTTGIQSAILPQNVTRGVLSECLSNHGLKSIGNILATEEGLFMMEHALVYREHDKDFIADTGIKIQGGQEQHHTGQEGLFMARIIADIYTKGSKHIWGDDPGDEFNQRILAVNDMYGWLYNQGILEKVSFEFKDYDDATFFALDAKDLAPYRVEMEASQAKGAALAVRHIFDEDYTPCTYSGAIELGWTMMSYRSVDGCVGRSWECGLVKGLNTDGIYEVADVRDGQGVKAAVQFLFSQFDWSLTLPEQKRYQEALNHFGLEVDTNIENDHVKDHARELLYCYDNNKTLIDFDFWTRYETLCDEKLTFDEYLTMDRFFDGDPHDVQTSDLDTISGFKKTLNSYRASMQSQPVPVQTTSSSNIQTLKDAESALEAICKVTFLCTSGPGTPHSFEVYIKAPEHLQEQKDHPLLDVDDRIRAYDKAVDVVGEDAISNYVIRNAEVLDGIWFLVYKDTLGHADEFDNLTEICVPAQWFLESVDTGGLSLKDWFNDYVADETADLAAKAIADGVILACSDSAIDIAGIQANHRAVPSKVSLKDQIQSASNRTLDSHEQGRKPEHESTFDR